MTRPDTIPYPPGPDPDDVPDDLTALPRAVVAQERLLLLAQLVLIGAYCGLIAVTLFLSVYLALRVPTGHVFAAAGAAACGLLSAVFARALFRRSVGADDPRAIEVTEQDQPTLFAFIRRVSEEAGADEPRKVLLAPGVNAGVIPRVTVASLVAPPRKDLLIGLGLVNAVNLSEFKAVLAHEFGHVTQSEFVRAYGVVVENVIANLVRGEDGFDRALDRLRRSGGPGVALAALLGAGPRAVSWLLTQADRLLAVVYAERERDRELAADRIAVSLAGSDAVANALRKTRLGRRAFDRALADLRKAAAHRLYTADLYFHQHAAADLLRRRGGDPPHPDDAERGENVRARFVPAAIDGRSPWLLFDDPAGLRRRMTDEVYRSEFRLPKGMELTDPRAVQAFIDDEYREATFDPKYGGVYDERLIAPGDPDELNDLIRREPWPDDRLIAAHAELDRDVQGRGHDRAGEWFAEFDRRAYLVFAQMAYRVTPGYYFDLVHRYRFHLAVQRMYESARHHAGRAASLCDTVLSREPVRPDNFAEAMHALREARAALKAILREARAIDLPAMTNFAEGDRLLDFLLDEDIVGELPATDEKREWIDELLAQLDQVAGKAARLRAKSLGGILRLQEEVAAKFLAARGVPTAAAAGG